MHHVIVNRLLQVQYLYSVYRKQSDRYLNVCQVTLECYKFCLCVLFLHDVLSLYELNLASQLKAQFGDFYSQLWVISSRGCGYETMSLWLALSSSKSYIYECKIYGGQETISFILPLFKTYISVADPEGGVGALSAL